MLLIERRGEQAEFGELLPVLALPPRFALHDRAARVERIVVLHELLHAVAQQRLLFRKGKIHGRSRLVFCVDNGGDVLEAQHHLRNDVALDLA